MQHDRLFPLLMPNKYSTDKITKAFIVNANLVSLSTTGHSKKVID